jgi:hypothetical protein
MVQGLGFRILGSMANSFRLRDSGGLGFRFAGFRVVGFRVNERNAGA